MTPLYRTFAFKKMSAVSTGISGKLKFYMSYPLKEFFYIQPRFAECCSRFCSCHFKFLPKLFFIVCESDTSSTSTVCRFKQYRIPGVLSDFYCLVNLF